MDPTSLEKKISFKSFWSTQNIEYITQILGDINDRT